MIECPGCGGNLKFDIASQKMHCDYCDSMFDPYDFDGKQKDAEEQELYEVTVFVCPQCGGELYSTDNAAAAFCSFCGASTSLCNVLKCFACQEWHSFCRNSLKTKTALKAFVEYTCPTGLTISSNRAKFH